MSHQLLAVWQFFRVGCLLLVLYFFIPFTISYVCNLYSASDYSSI
jgi:hypothetical protein